MFYITCDQCFNGSMDESHTVAVNEVSEIEIQFSDGYVDMMRINTERRMDAVRRLFQPLSVGAFQRDGAEQYHHDEVEPPDFVGLSEAVDASHLALLVGVAKDARCMTTAGRDAVDEVFATILRDVFAQLRQQSRRPLLLRVRLLRLHSTPTIFENLYSPEKKTGSKNT